MNKIRAVLFALFIAGSIPLVVSASYVWTGNGVYNEASQGSSWDVSADEIVKEYNPGRVYSIDDLSTYSAYISNISTMVGNNIRDGFYWYNESRLGYVKLIKVKPGQEVSFLFSEERYVYFAEYSSDYTLLNEGSWITTGDKLKLMNGTEWIMLVFRNPNGDLGEGAGKDTRITVSDISSLTLKYLILEPFVYTLDLNGGSYENNTGSITMERLGVARLKLPIPVKSGYVFTGWKASDGKLYEEELPVEYNKALFTNAKLSAVWEEIVPQKIEFDRENAILDKDNGECLHITAKVYPESALDTTVKWSSSDEKVAIVDSNGNVTAKSPGKAIITATASNGVKQSCTVYVMGFEVSVPDYCSLDENYEIKINIFYNGEAGMNNRKHVVLMADERIELVRVGDIKTSYEVLAESSLEYNGKFKNVEAGEYLVDTTDSVSVYYRLKSVDEIKKSGDYEGNVTFTVSVY